MAPTTRSISVNVSSTSSAEDSQGSAHMPNNCAIALALLLIATGMQQQAEALLAFSEGRVNQVDLLEGKLCGTSCQDLVDGSGTAVCASTWREGCGEEAPPPAGFGADASVAELCSLSCAWYTFQHSA